MVEIIEIATTCDSYLSVLGLLIASTLFVALAFILYKTIRLIGIVIVKFTKVDFAAGDNDRHLDVHLRR